MMIPNFRPLKQHLLLGITEETANSSFPKMVADNLPYYLESALSLLSILLSLPRWQLTFTQI